MPDEAPGGVHSLFLAWGCRELNSKSKQYQLIGVVITSRGQVALFYYINKENTMQNQQKNWELLVYYSNIDEKCSLG